MIISERIEVNYSGKPLNIKKQRLERIPYENGVLSPVPESLFNKVAGLRPATLLKKRLWHRCTDN